MKKIAIFLIISIAFVYGQCLSSPISTRVGIKFGLNPGTYDLADNTDKFSGTGMHVGFGMGTDIINLISLDITPQFRTTNYSRDEVIRIRTYSYSNLYFPIFLALKGGMIPLISPYIGLGIGINVPASATRKDELPNGTVIENPESGTTAAHLIFGGGLELKLLKFRISPEFTALIQSPEDENGTPVAHTTDYHISVGLYYSP